MVGDGSSGATVATETVSDSGGVGVASVDQIRAHFPALERVQAGHRRSERGDLDPEDRGQRGVL